MTPISVSDELSCRRVLSRGEASLSSPKAHVVQTRPAMRTTEEMSTLALIQTLVALVGLPPNAPELAVVDLLDVLGTLTQALHLIR